MTTDHELPTYGDALFDGYATPLLLCGSRILDTLVQLCRRGVSTNDKWLLVVRDERRLRCGV